MRGGPGNFPLDIELKADQLLAVVEDGASVVSGALSAEPSFLMRAFGRRAAQLSRVELRAGLFLGAYDFLCAPSVRFSTWFPPGRAGGFTSSRSRALIEYLPMGWSQVIDYLTHRARIDVLLIQVSPADSAGYHSFGTSASYVAPAASVARHVIAEVNQAMPFTYGARIHASQLTATLDVNQPLPAFPRRVPGVIDQRIAENVTRLIADGRSLQLGVGSLPEAVLRQLGTEGRHDMRLYGGAIPASIVDFVASGALADGSGAIVAGEVLGDQDVYDFIHRNQLVRMTDGNETHGARALSQVQGLSCINSALSVDIFGQVNTEYVDEIQVGAIGGAVEFSRAGTWPGNQGILALRSTTQGNRVSRIVRSLGAATVSLPRDSTHFVVTEYGVADLRDKTVRQRQLELAKVAHPAFRTELETA